MHYLPVCVSRSLADLNNDGKMDKKEFSIAMHLIKLTLTGREVPKSLPPSMLLDPVAVMGGFGTIAPAMGGGRLDIQH